MEPFSKTSENQWWNHVGYLGPKKISSPAEVSMDQGQFKTPMLASFRHSSSKLSGKNAMEGMGQFHWHLLPVAGAIWSKKTSCSGERAIPNSVLFPILFHYIMAYMHAKSQVFIWGGKRGRIFHSPTNQHHSSSSKSIAWKESTKIRTSR